MMSIETDSLMNLCAIELLKGMKLDNCLYLLMDSDHQMSEPLKIHVLKYISLNITSLLEPQFRMCDLP